MKKIEYLMNSLQTVSRYRDGSILSARAWVEEITTTSFFGFFKKETRKTLRVHKADMSSWKMSETGEYCSDQLERFCKARVELIDMETQRKKLESPKQKQPLYAIDEPETMER